MSTRLNTTADVLELITAQDPAEMRDAMEDTPDGLSTTVRTVRSQAQLVAALALAGEVVIQLDKAITLTTAIVVPVEKCVETNHHRFIKGTGGSIRFVGELIATRRQIFSGFSSGDVVGPFGGQRVFPEWWGLTAGYHDLAINAAIQTSPYLRGTGQSGVIVDLGPRTYDVSAPLNLSGSRCSIIGKGPASTYITSTANWVSTTWHNAIAPNWTVVTGGNHSAIIWIGSSATQPSSYFMDIRGVYINGYEASKANPVRYVSLISSRQGVEENCNIHNIAGANFSGCGIGFPGHDGNSAVINGLRVTNYHITNSMRRESMGCFTTHWAYNAYFDLGTLNLVVHKSISAEYAVVGGGNPVAYPAPAVIYNYPLIAFLAGGRTSIGSLHVEGAVFGVGVIRAAAPQSVTIQSVDVNHMMDPVRGAVYFDDARSGNDIVPANTDWMGYSAAILIAGAGGNPVNTTDRVCCNGAMIIGKCVYLVRDYSHGKQVTGYGRDTTPTTSAYAGFAHYSRGSIYINNLTSPYGPISNGPNCLGPI